MYMTYITLSLITNIFTNELFTIVNDKVALLSTT